MSVLVKGVKKPKDCFYCPFKNVTVSPFIECDMPVRCPLEDAADVQEVRHGRWIEQEADMDTIYECSVCGEPFVTIEGTPADNLWHYCPNCGSRMDLDGDTE